MSGKRFADRLAGRLVRQVWALALLGLVALWAPGASAIEIQLPGERTMDLNGFYELRLQFLGEDLPANGISMSQFRHVLNLETELEIFPDGFGPFDFMMAYTRWIVRYECAYQGGCFVPGFKNNRMFESLNFYGDDPERMPRNLKLAQSNPSYNGGLIYQGNVPGSLRSSVQDFNQHVRIPGTPAREAGETRRYQGPVNAPGILANANPLGVFSNLNARSKLDPPIRSFANVQRRMRAATYNPVFHVNYLQFARADLGAVGSQALFGKFLTGQSLRAVAVPGAEISGYGRLTALNAGIAQLAAGRIVSDDLALDVLKAERNALLFDGAVGDDEARLEYYTIDPFYRDLYDLPETSEFFARNLLETRPDANRYEILARATSAELLAAQFARAQLPNSNLIPYLATIETPIRPDGYFSTGGSSIDIVPSFAAGLSDDLTKIDLLQVQSLGGASVEDLANGVIPRFFGPDGLRNSADDLPADGLGGLVLTAQGDVYGTWDQADPRTGAALYSRLANFPDPVTGAIENDDRLNGGVPLNRPYVLYGEFSDASVSVAGCSVLGGTPSFTFGDPDANVTCDLGNGEILGGDEDSRRVLFETGCKSSTNEYSEGGVNTDGKCIQLNVDSGTPVSGIFGAGVAVQVVEALGRTSFRPASAELEPADLTDVVVFSEKNSIVDGRRVGRTPFARPRAAGNELFFDTEGVRNLKLSSNALVSSLDLDFDQNELRWGHGASDDEHEFREGYLEFEMFDSQLFARIGKLIMVWGKTELFRNQDRMNPVDLSNGVITRLEEARVGQWAANFVISPEAFMRVGPVEDLRLELAVIFDDFEPTDLGKCGENSALQVVCLKSFGAYAHGLAGIGVVGEVRPDKEYTGLKRMDYGIRLEGRWDRFTFAITDFWGWDDGFHLDVVNRYVRRVDGATGAPVNSVGGLDCKYRVAFNAPLASLPPGAVAGVSGTGNALLSGGPDGDITTADDNAIASVGNCLLFDNPTTATAQQTVRAGESIAASHSANQTLFHLLCTLTFDPDQGFCAFDRLTNPDQFQLIAVAFSGQVAGAVLQGVESVRYVGDPYAGRNPLVGFNDNPGILVLGPTDPDVIASARTFPFTPEQGALLGCGPAFASACGTNDLNVTFGQDPDGVVAEAFGLANLEAEVPGGIDFMNADASVLTQEFTALKAASPGALIGTRNRDFDALGNFASLTPLRWEAGITVGGQSQAELEALAGTNGLSVSDLTAQNFSSLSLTERANLIEQIANAAGAGTDDRPSDGWIEPYPWALDEEALARGEVLYKVADLTQRDPRCDPNLTFDADGNVVDRATPGQFSAEEEAYCRARSPRWNPAFAERIFIGNDPTDPTNPQNVFIDDYERVADVCHPFANRGTEVGRSQPFLDQFAGGAEAFAFDRGCTRLERFSANLERFLMLIDVVGLDQFFDPPETVDEIFAMLDGDYSNDHFGDPVAGPDGIFTRNGSVFNPDVFDAQIASQGVTLNTLDVTTIDDGLIADVEDDQGDLGFRAEDIFFLGGNYDVVDADGNVVRSNTVDPFVVGQTGTACRVGSGSVRLKVGSRVPLATSDELFPPTRQNLITALPVCADALVDDPASAQNGQRIKFSPLYLANADDADCDRTAGECETSADENEGQLALARLLAGESVRVNTLQKDAAGNDVIITIRVPASTRSTLFTSGAADIDRDLSAVRDLDQNQDGVWDGADDFTPGPVSDDNILCGSGLPGDLLQNAIQYELLSSAEVAKAEAVFGTKADGSIDLPTRSPTNCRGVSALLGATTQTLPFVRAGGDGSYGRRDFLWQGGQQVSFGYERRNVFGFALDFAEDNTKTSWGIEFSWTADRFAGNTKSFTGLSQHDVLVMSISVDRPTFFNFLNPNRSFFLNFQFFMQYIFDYEGGRDSRDGNFGIAEQAFSVPVVTFTFFTGYFQDRLGPRTTFVFSPDTQTFGILWGLSYRWSGSFSTSLQANQFWGHGSSIQRGYFPITQYGDNQLLGPSLRGLTPVVNRDTVFLNVRYSW